MTPNKKEHSISVVYKITNLVNGKIYVGSSANFYKRYLGHINSGRVGFKMRTLVHRAMYKYGIDKFNFEIIERVEKIEDLFCREQYWIDTLKPLAPKGYNLEPTAGSPRGRIPDAETRRKMSESQKRRELTKESIDHLAAIRPLAAKRNKEKLSVPVHQISMESLEIINTFPSMEEAAKAVGADPSNIYRSCSREIKSSKGFYWTKTNDWNGKFAPKEKTKIGQEQIERTRQKRSNSMKGRKFSDEHRKNLSKANLNRVEDIRSQMSVPCLQIDVKTLFVIQEYPSMLAASENLAKDGVFADSTNISRACNRTLATCAGFYWCRKDDYEKNGFTPKRTARRFGSPHCVPIYQMSLDGEIIQAWESAEEARRGLGLKRSGIWECLNARKSDAHGFKWAKIEDSELKNQIINDRRSRLAKLRAEEAAQL